MSKNQKQLDSFVKYCKENPSLRFWQALSSWSGFGIYASNVEPISAPKEFLDTFYWEEQR